MLLTQSRALTHQQPVPCALDNRPDRCAAVQASSSAAARRFSPTSPLRLGSSPSSLPSAESPLSAGRRSVRRGSHAVGRCGWNVTLLQAKSSAPASARLSAEGVCLYQSRCLVPRASVSQRTRVQAHTQAKSIIDRRVANERCTCCSQRRLQSPRPGRAHGRGVRAQGRWRLAATQVPHSFLPCHASLPCTNMSGALRLSAFPHACRIFAK